uniref:uncharacterized protein LOC120832697 isoform X2 n=1 Tax=Gasterosteus aculeatus aculeatus TaxID=481459 RepID=UPI001A984EBA|nr:uncharacterized protein LOC120832697 isoform X2 [Gasterosteus aculeatus aculeatus]
MPAANGSLPLVLLQELASHGQPVYFLQFGCSWSIECTTSPHSRFSDQTEYNVSDTSRVPDVNEPDCTFTWSDNATVIADHRSKDPKWVVEYSINYLITPKCSDNISFKRMCSEGIGYLAHCEINCTLRALQRSQEQEIDAGPGVAVNPAAVAVNRGVAAGAAAGVFLLAIVLLCVLANLKNTFPAGTRPDGSSA